MQLEDIGIYWDLPNYDECKHYYFQAVDLGIEQEEDKAPYPVALTPDEIIEDHY